MPSWGLEMPNSLPTGRVGQLLALGLTSLPAAAIVLGVVMPLTAWHGERADALLQRAALMQRMQALAAAVPELQEQAKAAAASKAGQAALLEGDSDSIASAALQERLQAIVMQAGVELNSVETLPGEEAGSFRRIRLRMSFNASWSVLLGLLKDLHLATPSLLVDELQLRATLHRINTPAGTFDVSCAILAFRSGRTQADAPRATALQVVVQ